jgi:hypothetical protein
MSGATFGDLAIPAILGLIPVVLAVVIVVRLVRRRGG